MAGGCEEEWVSFTIGKARTCLSSDGKETTERERYRKYTEKKNNKAP